MTTIRDDHVTWFRHSSPYINAHRNKTFVVLVPGDAIASPHFDHIIHDLALLHSLGIRLVLVHGARPQISARLENQGIASHFEQQTRITDNTAMPCVIDAVGHIRLQLEGRFSMGLANTPLYNAGLRVVSGNFVTAKPVGVRDGKDYQFTGTVRRIQADSIRQQLDNNNILVLSPLGCSTTGELFNLNSEEVAAATAIALAADKLILMGEDTGIRDDHNTLLRELTPDAARRLIANGQPANPHLMSQLAAAVHACDSGVPRSHLIHFATDGALIRELFTRDGCGTLVTPDNTYETLRQASINDVGGILELIEPLEANGTLVKRSRERLEEEIPFFTVIERDGMIIGCAALYPLVENQAGELACVAIHPDYRNSHRASHLLHYIEKQAHNSQLTDLYVLTTQASHWFLEQGFQEVDIETLPVAKRKLYNHSRNSKVFRKTR